MDTIKKLEKLGYTIKLNNNKISCRYNGPGRPNPSVVKPLFDELRRRKHEAAAYLRRRATRQSGPDIPGEKIVFRDGGYCAVVMGRYYKMLPTDPDCMEAGHCLWLRKDGCNLYPVFLPGGRLSGWCRRREPERKLEQWE